MNERREFDLIIKVVLQNLSNARKRSSTGQRYCNKTKPNKSNSHFMKNKKTESVPAAVSAYMAKIGAKGGKANPAGTAKRRKQAKAAINARWAKWRAAQKNKKTEGAATK